MSILPEYNDIVELIKKGATLEAQEKILELRAEAVRLQGENIDLKEQIKNLENALSVKERLTYEAPYYWLETEEGKDGPYCQHCHDKHKKLIRLQASVRGTKGKWMCEACQKPFYDKDYNPPKLAAKAPSRQRRERW